LGFSGTQPTSSKVQNSFVARKSSDEGSRLKNLGHNRYASHGNSIPTPFLDNAFTPTEMTNQIPINQKSRQTQVA